jgi:hypothetical protein
VIALEIANATRFTGLSRAFFAHAIVTVGAGLAITRLELLRDGRLDRVVPMRRELRAGAAVPVTGFGGPYEEAAIASPTRGPIRHVQADLLVRRTGWYALLATLEDGRSVVGDAVRFEATSPQSHGTSSLVLLSADVDFRWLGYGEEMPLAEIPSPFVGDRWWYPGETAWRMEGHFGGPPQIAANDRADTLEVRHRPVACIGEAQECVRPLAEALAAY